MNKKTVNRINGGIAIYYGIASIIGAIGGVVGTAIWLYKAFTHQADFNWWAILGLIGITTFLALLGYAILRVGYEEIEK